MKKIIFATIIMLFSSIALPALARVNNFKDLVNKILIDGLLRPLPMLLVGLAVIIFIYGVITLIFSEGGDKKEEGKQYMVWGIVGIFVMVSVWGLVNILINTFNLQ
jgi:amino acid transporter